MELYHAIQWIHDLRLTNVDFEIDSKKVVDFFNRGRRDITEFGIIMDSSIRYCNSHLINYHVEFIRKQSNEVVHKIPYL